MSALANWMSDHRETDETLASKVEVSRVQISRIRRKLSRPSLALAEKLERETGITAWDLISAEIVSSEGRAA